MARDLVRVFHALPGPAQVAVAGMRGAYLRWMRYGPETDSLVAEAIERQSWTAERWRTWQETQAAMVLVDAAEHVPYYRALWSERRRRGDRSSIELLSSWPRLEKEALREHPHAFVREGRPTRWMVAEHTSGSTGKPLDLWWSRSAARYIYAVHEAYCNLWYGVTRRDRWAMLGGQMVTPASQKVKPFWVWNAPLNQLYMSSYHLSSRFIPDYCDAMIRYSIRYVAGYTSSLYQLALGVLDHGRTDLRLQVAITHAEPVAPHQRLAIERAFGCPLCETYGNAEGVSRASTCAFGRLHAWPQIGVIEAVTGAHGAEPGHTGELLCTGLQNPAMPLIRYAIGDRVQIAGDDVSCPCGARLPVISSIDGRVEDTLYATDGRPVQRFHAIPIGTSSVREMQIVQESLRRIRLRVVTTADFTPADQSRLTERLRERIGDIEIVLEQLTTIPREPNGKFKAVVCRLPEAELKRLRRHADAAEQSVLSAP